MEKESTLKFEIMRPTQDDVEGLIEMHAQSWLDAYPNPEYDVSREFIEEHVKRFTSDEGRAKRAAYVKESYENPDYYLRIVKDSDGKIIGFVDARKGSVPELCGLYIDKTAYGSGLARVLAEPALRWIGQENDIKLTVVAYNDRAQAFYKKLGFEAVPESDKSHDNIPLNVIDMIRKGDKQ